MMACTRIVFLSALFQFVYVQSAQSQCNAGEFGLDCFYKCHCGNSCNPVTGECISDSCDNGYIMAGDMCQKRNVAYNKSTSTTSGEYTTRGTVQYAKLAVDGNLNTYFEAEHSLSDFTVDLGRTYNISDIVVYLRKGFMDRIATSVVYPDRNFDDACFTFPAIINNTKFELTCERNTRYITIKNSKSIQPIHISEIEIYECSIGTYGLNCTNMCHCNGSMRCTRDDGLCRDGCKHGWGGSTCNRTCLELNRYGINCSKLCDNRKCAGNSSSCELMTGECVHGCVDGWSLNDCSKTCLELNRYGINCAYLCDNRNCARNASSCDQVTGLCAHGCLDGWRLNDCSTTCKIGLYGAECKMTCDSRNCNANSTCDHVTGSCDSGCTFGRIGIDCREQKIDPVHIVMAGVGALIIIVVICVTIIVLPRLLKRDELRMQNMTSEKNKRPSNANAYINVQYEESEKEQESTAPLYWTVEPSK